MKTNEISSLDHWRIQRRVKTDLRQIYCRNNNCCEKQRMSAITLMYSIFLYKLLTAEPTKLLVQARYKSCINWMDLLATKETKKYVKYHAIFATVNGFMRGYFTLLPLNIQHVIVKRINKIIDDKRRKLFIPISKKRTS